MTKVTNLLSPPEAYKQKQNDCKGDKADHVFLARVLKLDIHYFYFDIVKNVAFILVFFNS